MKFLTVAVGYGNSPQKINIKSVITFYVDGAPY
jgi:hypothetical protein